MGDRGRELTHRGDAVGVRELQLHLAVSLLAFASLCLAFRDVAVQTSVLQCDRRL